MTRPSCTFPLFPLPRTSQCSHHSFGILKVFDLVLITFRPWYCSAEYLASERAAFLVGYPPFDFSGGDGETHFKNRATKDDVPKEVRVQRALGFIPFEALNNAAEAQKNLVAKANAWLF